ncbi:hypothetical protein SAMN04488540_10595 [Ferrimonas sediminum]|uniref:DNA repair protein n=1 Tax=Ferrimonas sediminum TaxID=718193 RepID=A0A1G8R8J0_9GAMM|nr:hypothetical protein [Ferrimonas sediminum]SDJ13268.1 hypothetical protein SAMN04488540_10595 [Ferrimonas sediminum]
MSFFAVVVMVVIALLVIIAINLVYQHHEAKEANRRKELARQRAIIEESEDILSQAAVLPMSNALLQTLNQRILDALKTAKQMSPASSDMDSRIAQTMAQLKGLQDSEAGQGSIDLFQLPSNEKQTLVLIQTLKKLKPVLRNEHNKGRINAEVFTDEELKIDKLQLRIHIEVLLNRARNLVNARQYGSAKMLLSKITLALNNQVLASPEYRTRMLAKTNELLDTIEGSKQPVESNKPKRADDLDELFQPKKKW